MEDHWDRQEQDKSPMKKTINRLKKRFDKNMQDIISSLSTNKLLCNSYHQS
jgi:hypothetical protein